MATLWVELTYPIKEWGHILQNIKQENRHLFHLSYVLDMARINSQAIYVINNAKVDVDSFEFGWELMKALVKPNTHTCLVKTSAKLSHTYTRS